MSQIIREQEVKTPEERAEERKGRYDEESKLLIINMRDTMTQLLNKLDFWNLQLKALQQGRVLEDQHFDGLPFTREQWGSAVTTLEGINTFLAEQGRYGALNLISNPQSRGIK